MAERQAEDGASIYALWQERRQKLPEEHRPPSERPWGLALSGGGIRSATFCFGLVKALAKNGLFHKFDLLSTVSGGGYIGSTVGMLYQDRSDPTSEAPADEAIDPLEVERGLAEAETRWFAAWLRANGRYLIPGGTRDLLFAAATFGRNLLGIHVEFACLSILLGCLLVAIDLGVWQWVDCAFMQGQCGHPGWFDSEMLGFLSSWPTLWLLLPFLVWFSVVLACCYWAMPSSRDKPVSFQYALTASCALLGFVLLVRHGSDWLTGSLPLITGDLPLPLGPTVIAAALLLAWFFGIVAALGFYRFSTRGFDWVRNRLTAALARTMAVALIVSGLGVADYLAWMLGNLDMAKQGTFGGVLAVSAIALRALLPKIADLPKSLTPLIRRAVTGLLGLGGLILVALAAIFWMSLVHKATSSGLFVERMTQLQFDLAWQWFAWLAIPAGLWVVVSAGNKEFLNRSSLFLFYRARLIRSYLGAANARRFCLGEEKPRSFLERVRACRAVAPVGEVQAEDDLAMTRYAPHRQGGPVHLINVCVNQSRDPKGQLFNQDRKGLLLTVAPGGLMSGSARSWHRPQPEAALTLGSWMAISGAAVAPGLGASTRPGIAAVLMLAGIRLGYWWDSEGLGGAPGDPMQKPLGKYSQFLCELFGRFNGDQRRNWYLSDGGHFENTGAYALLREECELIVVADCGVDPRYAFADLENLVRKARIDLQADITFLRPKVVEAAANPNDPTLPPAFGSLNELASSDSQACLALARIDYRHSGARGHMVIVKPNMCHGTPVDLVNFKADNPLFPQEPTTDQFFSEAQWESYFQLGQTIGSHIGLDQLRDAARFATVHFVDDDGAMRVKNANGESKLEFSSKRLSSRIAATGAVSASVGLGAIASLGMAVWQAVDKELNEKTVASRIEPATLKELTDIFGKMAPAGSAAAGDARVGEMATALLRVGDAACRLQNVEAFRQSNLMALMLAKTKEACAAARPGHASCEALLDDNRLSPCLQMRPRVVCSPRYWTRDYAAFSLSEANCWAPERGPSNGAASAGGAAVETASPPLQAESMKKSAPPSRGRLAPAPAPEAAVSADPELSGGSRRMCERQTIYLQIYGPELRDSVRRLRAPWRRAGASVPPVEDVWDSALRAGRRRPQPVLTPTVFYYHDDSRACAESLRPPGATSEWKVTQLPGNLKGNDGVIEVWLPPNYPLDEERSSEDASEVARP